MSMQSIYLGEFSYPYTHPSIIPPSLLRLSSSTPRAPRGAAPASSSCATRSGTSSWLCPASCSSGEGGRSIIKGRDKIEAGCFTYFLLFEPQAVGGGAADGAGGLPLGGALPLRLHAVRRRVYPIVYHQRPTIPGSLTPVSPMIHQHHHTIHSALPLSYLDDSAVSTAQYLVDGKAIYNAYAAAIKGEPTGRQTYGRN